MFHLALLALLQEPAPATTWKLPPPEIVALLDAAPTPDVEISPDGTWMLFVEHTAMPSIAEVMRAWVPLAGVRVDTQLSMPQRVSFATGLVLRQIDGRADDPLHERRIQLPKDARIADVSWSPRSTRFAFTLAQESSTELWTADVESALAHRVAQAVNGVLGDPFTWTSGGDLLLAKLVDPRRGDEPKRGLVPTGPAVQETHGSATALRTYTDLLRDADDERLFAWSARVQPAWIDLRNGTTTPFGAPGIYVSLEASTDGEHVLVTRIEAPFSYVFPWNLFPQHIEAWDALGRLERSIADVPMGDAIPVEGVRTGPRDVRWAASEPATLVWVEAQDGGDPKAKAEARDRWFRQPAPFTAKPEAFLTLTQRARGLTFLGDPALVLATEFDRDRRWTRTLLVDRTRAPGTAVVVDDRSVNERYADPGAFASCVGPFGTRIVRQDGEWLYRVGQGANPEGARPFLDRWSTVTRKSDRLWQCAPETYETLVAIVWSSAAAKARIVTAYETPADPPNFRLRDLEKNGVKRLTEFGDPQAGLRAVHQELVKYKRADGVELSAKLYLPPGWKAGQHVPLLVWAYPLEFSDAATAGQVTSSPFRFVRVRGPSQLLFALHGYAVMDEAAMPVVGDPETVNDSFLAQIELCARAAIDEAVRRGVTDRDHAGVGGHSYGAFMTANLLAHTDLFRAGIARSGAYNRTLTPFGFQSERRTLWEAPKSYLDLSPFLAADKLKAPLLLIHGEKDANMGTFPIQSERMYQAIKGNGGTARLVLLPGESHGYQARESVLDVVAEMFAWFDRYVRDAAPRGPVDASAPAGGH